MNYQTLSNQTQNTDAKVEIRQHAQKYYAVLSVNDHTIGVSETFNAYSAATLAGTALIERYHNNLRAGSSF